MSEYRASITYQQVRHFPKDGNGQVIPSGELVRFEEMAITAYVKPDKPQDVEAGQSFEGRILFVSQIESERPFKSGQELELVAPAKGDLKVIGRCVVLEKIA